MRENQASITATGIAAARALESEKPDGERLIYDPYARQFVSPWMFRFMKFFVKIGYAERRGPGVIGFLIGRERYIDDFLGACLQDGLGQLVILGAGYDARAYRFKEELEGVKVFEVDHPATQKDKLARLEEILGRAPEHVTFVAVDFTTQALAEQLQAAGYDPGLKTLFIWQGVTMYLSAEAVEETLRSVCRSAAPGSAIIFDYIDPRVLEGREKHGEVQNIRRYRFLSGEGFNFGIEPGQAEAYLKGLGFREAQNIRSEDLGDLYFSGKNAGRKVTSGYGIAAGIV